MKAVLALSCLAVASALPYPMAFPPMPNEPVQRFPRQGGDDQVYAADSAYGAAPVSLPLVTLESVLDYRLKTNILSISLTPFREGGGTKRPSLCKAAVNRLWLTLPQILLSIFPKYV